MDNLDPPMKVSFKVEIEGCEVKDKAKCPFLQNRYFHPRCTKITGRWAPTDTARANMNQLTKTCPMVRAQFEALE